jgi:hypothetical protein
VQFYRSVSLSLCESCDFEKFRNLYEDESVCFAEGVTDNDCLLAACILYDSCAIFSFLLKHSPLSELCGAHDCANMPSLLHTAIVLHRDSMFRELVAVGVAAEDTDIFVKCCHVAVQCCNWSLLQTLLKDIRFHSDSEATAASLILNTVKTLHAPSVLALLQAIHSRNGTDFLKKCLNTSTPNGLTVLNVLLLLLRSCERDTAAAGTIALKLI